MTFLLVMTVYAAAVAKPGHGNTAPLAIGLSLYAAALTGEQLHAPCSPPSPTTRRPAACVDVILPCDAAGVVDAELCS
jgi:hypothetical protein